MNSLLLSHFKRFNGVLHEILTVTFMVFLKNQLITQLSAHIEFKIHDMLKYLISLSFTYRLLITNKSKGRWIENKR